MVQRACVCVRRGRSSAHVFQEDAHGALCAYAHEGMKLRGDPACYAMHMCTEERMLCPESRRSSRHVYLYVKYVSRSLWSIVDLLRDEGREGVMLELLLSEGLGM